MGEALDFFTDAQQIALARLCDGNFRAAWVQSLEESYIPPAIVNGVKTAGLWQLMLGTLLLGNVIWLIILGLYACCSQCAHIANNENDDTGPQLCAFVLANLGWEGLSPLIHENERNTIIYDADGIMVDPQLTQLIMEREKEEGEIGRKFVKAMWKSFSLVLFEAVPELYFQTSLFSLTFDETESHKFQLFSLALSSVSVLRSVVPAFQTVKLGTSQHKPGLFYFSGFMVLHGVCTDLKHKELSAKSKACKVVCFFVTLVLWTLPTIGLLVFLVGVVFLCWCRVYMTMRVCSSHIWNLTSGCVSLPNVNVTRVVS